MAKKSRKALIAALDQDDAQAVLDAFFQSVSETDSKADAEQIMGPKSRLRRRR